MPLFTRLVLPLAMLFGAMLLIHNFAWEAGGFFLSIATELIGILITILYVNWVIEKHEQQEWNPAKERVAERLKFLLNRITAGLRTRFGISHEELEKFRVEAGEDDCGHRAQMLLVEKRIAPSIASCIDLLDEEGWSKLGKDIRESNIDAIRFFDMFHRLLTPSQITDLLDLQESLSKSLTYFEIFPDIMGVSKENLDKLKVGSEADPVQLQVLGNKNTTKELKRVCHLAKKLSESTS